MEFENVYYALSELVHMTKNQRSVVAMYVCMMQTMPEEPLQLWITGDHGSGKSQLAKVLRELLPARYQVTDGYAIPTKDGQLGTILAVEVKDARLKGLAVLKELSTSGTVKFMPLVYAVRMPKKWDMNIRPHTDEQIKEVLQKYGCLAA